ncbi:MAG: SUMF1/EgtB/PvdO family nonheme iron enzyme, partial [Polyangiaceae bacterium]
MISTGPHRPFTSLIRRLTIGVTSLGIIASVMLGAKSTPADVLSQNAQNATDARINAEAGASGSGSSNPSLSPESAFFTAQYAQPTDETLASLKLSATPGNPLEATAEAHSSCPAGMIDVEGDYCPWVEQKCLRWLDPETKMRCAEFAPTSECLTKTVKKHVCMDKYEYPNRVGADPIVMKTWNEARSTCSGEGKRLCTESEWTLACEGEERLPYPYGYARSSEACNIDKPHPDVNEKALG